VVQGSQLWIDSCGVHSIRSKVSNSLWETIIHYSKMCPACVDSSSGKVYSEGQSWNPTPCESCRCQNGTSNCVPIECVPPPCSDSYIPSAQCCPVCPAVSPQCLFGGNVYSQGESWNPSTCEKCTCNNGLVNCLLTSCTPTSCSNAYTPVGQCCPVCPLDVTQCVSNGQAFSNGETVSSSSCGSCICNYGAISCTTTQCLIPKCNNSYVPSGECCTICPPLDCLDQNGERWADGERWELSPCDTCMCTSGVINCNVQTCQSLTCTNPIVPQNTCCPVCR